MPDVTPSPSRPAELEQVLRTTYSLFDFDKTVLLPMNGCKLVGDRKSGLTLQESHQADNLSLLACSDIGVVCGAPSHNLAVIRFREEKHRADFLVNNPLLKDTLLTSSPGCFCVWVRIEGWYPKNREHPSCGWVSSDKCVVVATRQPDSRNRFDNHGHPVTLKFKEIVWPDADLAMCWAFQMASMEYEITVLDKHGDEVVNDDFLASMFTNMHANVFFNPVTGTFYERLADGQNKTYHVEEVKKSFHGILSYIRQQANKPAVKTSGEATGKAPLHVDTGLKYLATLVELLKILAVKPIDVPEAAAPVPMKTADAEAKGFDEFILTQLEPALGQDLTVAEAFTAYTDYCALEDHPRYLVRQFRDRLGDAVKREFGIGKNHDTIRDGMCRRGFRNLRLKRKDVEPKIEIIRMDRTDRTPFLPGLDWSDSTLSRRNVKPGVEVCQTLGTVRTPCLPGDLALTGEMAAAA